jgi:hypothetical protein
LPIRLGLIPILFMHAIGENKTSCYWRIILPEMRIVSTTQTYFVLNLPDKIPKKGTHRHALLT